MTPNAQNLYSLIREIRGAFHDLKAVSDRMNTDVDITAPLRAILEHITDHGPMTVPQISAAKNVTRQHIQTGVDDLVERGFVMLLENPNHKRSRRVALTEPGKAAFSTIRDREALLLTQLAERFDPIQLKNATDTVAKLRAETDNL